MILSVESEGGYDEAVIAEIQDALGCDASDHEAAMEHIEKHRDDGRWGGRREAVLHRSADRLTEAQTDDRLPSGGPLSDKISELIGDDDGEVDPFAELGISGGGGGGGYAAASVAVSNDPLAAFMDDDEEEEEMVVDDSGFLASTTIDETAEEAEEEEPEAEEEPEDEEVEEEPEADAVEAQTDPEDAYRMLMSTCWIDGILDPAEAKLLARKRDELNIPFIRHLELLREMLERAS